MPKPTDAEKARRDHELDEELEDTFPASDPPSITQPPNPEGEDEDED